MGAVTNIAWTDATWNVCAGCTPVSPGCLHCYAAVMAHRQEAMEKQRGDRCGKYQGLTVLRNGIRSFNGKIKLDTAALALPLHWKAPRRIFVNSMSDLFHGGVPFSFVARVYAVMAKCPQHTFQVLTKRPERRYEFYKWVKREQIGIDLPLANVWEGTSVEDQARKRRIEYLRRVPAALRFLSLEPLLEDLGPLDLADIGWVIAGGESGAGARACQVEWYRAIRDQCAAARVPFFLKQDSGPKPGMQGRIPADLRIREFPA